MLHFQSQIISIPLAGTLLLSGCVTTGSNADPRISSEAKFFSKSGLEACLATGGASAILVWGLDKFDEVRDGVESSKEEKEKKQKERNKKAVIAAVAGCAVGAGVNYYLDVKRSQYKSKQDRIRAEIDDVKKDNAQLASLITSSKEVIAEDKAEIKLVSEKLQANKITKAQAAEQLAQVDANRVELEKTLEALNERSARWREVAAEEKAAGANTKELELEISKLEKQVVSMQSALDDLNKYRTVVKTA